MTKADIVSEISKVLVLINKQYWQAWNHSWK
mgnify:CR=1 FL=1